jgi:hypothetical protein
LEDFIFTVSNYAAFNNAVISLIIRLIWEGFLSDFLLLLDIFLAFRLISEHINVVLANIFPIFILMVFMKLSHLLYFHVFAGMIINYCQVVRISFV